MAKAKLSTLLLIFFSVWGGGSFVGETWFNQQVTWTYGKEGVAWKATIKNPNSAAEYQLTLQPLWAVEGGVIALEVVLARPQQPDVNLLGERENGVESPFVITVQELKRGLAKSKFGAVRTLRVDDIVFNLKVERFRLGKGVGSGSTYCRSCSNLQELSMWVTIKDMQSSENSKPKPK